MTPGPLPPASEVRLPNVEKQADGRHRHGRRWEMGRFSFIPYVNERLTGLEPRPNARSAGRMERARAGIKTFPDVTPGRAQMPGAAGGASAPMGVHRPDRL